MEDPEKWRCNREVSSQIVFSVRIFQGGRAVLRPIFGVTRQSLKDLVGGGGVVEGRRRTELEKVPS
jgi:hypothetical protein